MEYVLGYGAGLLTLINPCVLPVLPIVLATAVNAHRHGPLAVAAGMSLSFVVLGMLVTVAGYSLGLTPETVADAGAVVMVGFGLVLVVPRFSRAFASATAGVSAQADSGIGGIEQGSLNGQFMAGLLLGAVWSPCIGPTLGGAIALASQGESLVRAGGIMVTFALGVSTIIIALGYGARAAIMRRQSMMRALAERSRPIMGWVFLLVGLGLLLRLNHIAEYLAVTYLPTWLIDLSVAL